LHPDAHAAYEIVIDGIDASCVAAAMRAALLAATGKDIVRISAGNYGGKLGAFPFYLRKLLSEEQGAS
jgi:formylmethanofuran--tetrahydromethanopterin N-formyltransferase